MALAAASTLVALGGIEIALRIRYPFTEVSWPAVHRRHGFSFKPGATVRLTNMRDFCVEQKANSLGFLDREPPEDLDPDEFRILVLGDSFVEAAQVEPRSKLPIQLENRLREAFPGRRFRVSALGASGCGTGDELAFYDRFRDRFRPDLVIILFVSNDFANNSHLLESVRNGWDPEHLPRPFFQGIDGVYQKIDVSGTWREHRIATRQPQRPARAAGALSRVLAFSTTAAWVRARFSDPADGVEELYGERVAWLRGKVAYRAALEGWEYPRDEDIDAMFFAEVIPPLFQEAVAVTGHILSEFRTRSARDGFRLLVVATDSCSLPPLPRKRKPLADGQLLRLRQLAHQRGLTVLDLGAYFRTRTVQGPTRFSRDGHWNPTGHRLASEAIREYLVAHSEEYLTPSPH